MEQLERLGLEARRLLGSGSFAQVYECFDRKEGKSFAVKMIQKEAAYRSYPSKKRLFAKEAEILAAIDHRSVVKFYSFLETDQCLIIKMELVRGGTLKRLIEERKRARAGFKDCEIALLFRHLLEGIRYLHALNIIHRDLKTENILLEDCEDLSSVKIVDFGLSAKLEVHNPANIKAQCGTLLYMAPEIFNKPSYTKSVDLWACAVILFMLFNEGAHPFYRPGMKTDEFKLRLKNEAFPALPDPLAQNFMEKISKKQYEERYNVSDALRHPWITRNSDDEIPLSIHESYKGFGSTSEINTLLRLFLAIGALVPHRRAELEESYRFRVNDFASRNEAVRVYSPSRRKMKDKNNELFNKMKQIFHASQDKNSADTISLSENFSEEASPTLKKHESFFQSLFEKEKSFDLVKLDLRNDNLELRNDKLELRKMELRNLHNNFELLEKEEIMFSLKVKRKKSFESESLEQADKERTMGAFEKEKGLALKIQQQIEECVSQAVKGPQRGQQHSKKRIFQKKTSMEEREKDRGSLKMGKKYSYGIESEKEGAPTKSEKEGAPTKEHLSLSTKQIYTRRTMSPVKNTFSKHMVFNLAGKNLSNTSRK